MQPVSLLDGSRNVSAHILPSTCAVKFPSDDWFTNAAKVEVSAVSQHQDAVVNSE